MQMQNIENYPNYFTVETLHIRLFSCNVYRLTGRFVISIEVHVKVSSHSRVISVAEQSFHFDNFNPGTL